MLELITVSWILKLQNKNQKRFLEVRIQDKQGIHFSVDLCK